MPSPQRPLRSDDGRQGAETFGNFPTLYLGLIAADGTREHYDGKLSLVDAEGKIAIATTCRACTPLGPTSPSPTARYIFSAIPNRCPQGDEHSIEHLLAESQRGFNLRQIAAMAIPEANRLCGPSLLRSDTGQN